MCVCAYINKRTQSKRKMVKQRNYWKLAYLKNKKQVIEIGSHKR